VSAALRVGLLHGFETAKGARRGELNLVHEACKKAAGRSAKAEAPKIELGQQES